MPLVLPLITDRLCLRDFTVDDCAAVQVWASDTEVVRYMQWGPNDEASTQDFVRQKLANQTASPRQEYDLAVVVQDDCRLIGACGIGIESEGACRGRVGYCLRRDAWGHGYATEAARMMLAVGFEHLSLHRIIATCDAENAASAHVLEKLGMRREGSFLQDVWVKGRWRDSFLYAMLAEEWQR